MGPWVQPSSGSLNKEISRGTISVLLGFRKGSLKGGRLRYCKGSIGLALGGLLAFCGLGFRALGVRSGVQVVGSFEGGL